MTLEVLRAIGAAVESVARELFGAEGVGLYLRGRSSKRDFLERAIGKGLAIGDARAEMSRARDLGYRRTAHHADSEAHGLDCEWLSTLCGSGRSKLRVVLALGREGRSLACGCDPWERWQWLVIHQQRSARWARLRDTCPQFVAARGIRDRAEIEETLVSLVTRRRALDVRIKQLRKWLRLHRL